MMKVGFIGAGAAGSALAVAMARTGVEVTAVASRRFERATRLADRLPSAIAFDVPQQVVDTVDLVVLAVPDSAIQPVCESLAWSTDSGVIHISGALSLDVLAAAARAGARVGSFHPLQSFTGSKDDWSLVAGSAIGIEAIGDFARELHSLACALGGRPIPLRPEDKVIYHAAAVMISNYLVTLASLAAELETELGLQRDEALTLLMPLLEGTTSNLRTQGLPLALTGPIARGDAGTVERHISVLARRRPEIEQIYRLLGRHTVPLAVERGGLDAGSAEQMLTILDETLDDKP